MRDRGVLLGIPYLVVDPVHHPVQVRAALLQHPLEPVAEGARADLPRVGAADGGEQVREDQRALEEVELAVELEAGGGEEVPPEPGHRHVVVPEHALVGEVVDGEQGREPAQQRVIAVERAQVDGQEPGLPVVGVDDLRGPADTGARGLERGQTLQGAAAEEHEALAVVPVVAVGGAVEIVAIVVVIVLQQVHRHAGGAVRLDEGPLRDAIPEGDLQPRHDDPRIGRVGLDPAVLRHHDPHVVPQARQRARQRARHVREAAGLGEGRDLGGHHQDAQAVRHPRPPPPGSGTPGR